MPQSEAETSIAKRRALEILELATRAGDKARVEMNAAASALPENSPMRRLILSWDGALGALLQEAGFRQGDLKR